MVVVNNRRMADDHGGDTIRTPTDPSPQTAHTRKMTHKHRRRRSIILTYITNVIIAIALLSYSSSLSFVTGARSRSSSSLHPLHVAITPMELRTIQQVTMTEEIEQMTMIRIYFDKAIRVHTPNQDESIVNLHCRDPDVSNRFELVTPVESWLDFFDEHGFESNGDSLPPSSSTSTVLPRGSIGAGGSPFASNSFVVIVKSAIGEAELLEECQLTVKSEAIVMTPTGNKNGHYKDMNPSLPLRVSLEPRSSTLADAKKLVRLRPTTVEWSDEVSTTRFVLPIPDTTPTSHTHHDLNDTKLAAACDALRQQQRLVFLENGVTSVGAIVGPIVSTMMAPVIEQFEQTSTVQTAQSISKNYVSALTGSIPPEVAHFVSESLSKGVTDIVVDLLTTSLTDSLSSSIAGSLGAYLTRSVSGDIGQIIHDHVLASLTQLIPPRLSTKLAVSVAKKLPQQILKDVSMSLTQTLTGALTRSMSNFNHMQKMCRMCALYKYRCSDCKYVQDTAMKLTHFSGQYSHYYAGYYSEYFAPIAGQYKVKELKDELLPGSDDEDPPEGGEGGAEGGQGGEGGEGGEGGGGDAAGGDAAGGDGGLGGALGGGGGDGGGGLAGALGGGGGGEGLGGALKGVGESLKGALQGGGGIDGLKNNLKNAVGEMKAKVGGAIKAKAQGLMDKAKGKLQGAMDKVKGQIGQKLGGLKEKLGGAMEKAGLGQFTDKLDGAFEKVESKVDGVFDKVQSKANELEGKAQGALDRGLGRIGFGGGGGDAGGDSDSDSDSGGGGGDAGVDAGSPAEDANDPGEEIQEEVAPEF